MREAGWGHLAIDTSCRCGTQDSDRIWLRKAR